MMRVALGIAQEHDLCLVDDWANGKNAIYRQARRHAALLRDTSNERIVTDGILTIVKMLQRIGIGDRVAFERLYEATSAKLFGVIIRILSDAGEAEDVLQDV